MGKTQVKQYLMGIWGQISPLLSWISSGSYHFDTPTVVYLKNPIGSKIFKLNKFGNNLDVKAFLDNNSTVPCESTGCSFVDKYHHHVMTGNLKIAQIFLERSKVPKSSTTDYGKAKESIITGIKSCI